MRFINFSKVVGIVKIYNNNFEKREESNNVFTSNRGSITEYER